MMQLENLRRGECECRQLNFQLSVIIYHLDTVHCNRQFFLSTLQNQQPRVKFLTSIKRQALSIKNRGIQLQMVGFKCQALTSRCQVESVKC